MTNEMKLNVIKNNRVICHVRVSDLNSISKLILELNKRGYTVELQQQAL